MMRARLLEATLIALVTLGELVLVGAFVVAVVLGSHLLVAP